MCSLWHIVILIKLLHIKILSLHKTNLKLHVPMVDVHVLSCIYPVLRIHLNMHPIKLLHIKILPLSKFKTSCRDLMRTHNLQNLHPSCRRLRLSLFLSLPLSVRPPPIC